jgi:hypothetical protein
MTQQAAKVKQRPEKRAKNFSSGSPENLTQSLSQSSTA